MKLFNLFTTGQRHTLEIIRRLTNYYLLGRFHPLCPTTLRVEITNHCNLKCRMCDHGIMERKPILMDWDLFRKIVDDAAALKVPVLGLNRFGEPTLHPRLPEMAAYAKKQGISSVSFTTNATLLNEDLCRRLLETNAVDVIACSVDANTKQTFESIRVGAVFEKVVENVERLVSMRNAMGLKRPAVQINCVLMKQNEHEFSGLLRRWNGVVDGITVLPAQEFGTVEDVAVSSLRRTGKRGSNKCAYLAYMLVAYADGAAGVCCGDSNGVIKVGDFHRQSISEIWNGKPLQKIREIHAKRQFDKLPVCRDCDMTYPFLYWTRGYIYAHYRKLFG